MQTLYRRSAVGDDDQTGRELVELVRNALQRGRAPGAAVVFRENRMDIIPFGPLVRAKVHIGTFIAALTRAEVDDAAPPQCVGIVGRFNWKRKGKGTGVPVAMVFLEWPDGRWWHWRAALSPEVQRSWKTRSLCIEPWMDTPSPIPRRVVESRQEATFEYTTQSSGATQ